MPVIELSESLEKNIGGKLAPRANQARYASVWAVKEGEPRDLTGFPSQRDLSQPQPFGHGSSRALSGYEAFTEPARGHKEGKEHIVTLNGVRLVEMVIDRESATARDKWEGEVSRSRVNNIRSEEIDRMARMGLQVSKEEFAEKIGEMPPEAAA